MLIQAVFLSAHFNFNLFEQHRSVQKIDFIPRPKSFSPFSLLEKINEVTFPLSIFARSGKTWAQVKGLIKVLWSNLQFGSLWPTHILPFHRLCRLQLKFAQLFLLFCHASRLSFYELARTCIWGLTFAFLRWASAALGLVNASITTTTTTAWTTKTARTSLSKLPYRLLQCGKRIQSLWPAVKLELLPKPSSCPTFCPYTYLDPYLNLYLYLRLRYVFAFYMLPFQVDLGQCCLFAIVFLCCLVFITLATSWVRLSPLLLVFFFSDTNTKLIGLLIKILLK